MLYQANIFRRVKKRGGGAKTQNFVIQETYKEKKEPIVPKSFLHYTF